MNEDKIIEVLLEEYKALWHYYEVLVREWNTFIDAYFKVIALPASVVGFLTVQHVSESGFAIDENISMAVLGVIGLAGLSLYVGYSKENRNGRAYEQAMKQIRAYLRDRHVDLHDNLIIDDQRKLATGIDEQKTNYQWNIFGIKYWRGAAMMMINSAIMTASVSMYFDFSTLLEWVVAFVVLVLLHTSIYELIMKEKKPKSKAAEIVG
jgi:hypothetical protein